MSFFDYSKTAILTSFCVLLASCGESPEPDNAAIMPFEAQASASGTPPTGKFLHLSDIHFDPTADGVASQLAAANVSEWEGILDKATAGQPMSYGTYKDANYPLMIASLKAAGERGAYDYIVYTGDYLAHDLNLWEIDEKAKFRADTIQFINMMIEKHIPDAPVIGSLGNNDAVIGDYRLAPGSDFLSELSGTMPLVKANAPAKAQFAKGGFYKVAHPVVPDHDFVVLSVFWSRQYDAFPAICSSLAQAGLDQLAMLETSLKDSKTAGRNVSLIMHIPPGIDAFKSRRNNDPYPMWCEQASGAADGGFEQRFESLVREYKDLLSVGFAGHTHMDEFRVIEDGTDPALAIRVGPAVTSWRKKHSAFTVMDYDTATGAVKDYTTYFLKTPGIVPGDSVVWDSGYSWNDYGVPGGYTPETTKAVADKVVAGDPAARKIFTDNYNRGGGMPGDTEAFACALDENTAATFKTCHSGS